MAIQFYKPTKSNSGFACSFSQSDKDNTIYATILKQAGWNAEQGVGVFKDSRNDPNKNVNIKLELVEIGGILDCLGGGSPFKTVHDTDKYLKTIQFVPWMDKQTNTQRGFSFSITVADKQDTTTKNSFYVGFNFAEGRLVKEFLTFALHKSFVREQKVQSADI